MQIFGSEHRTLGLIDAQRRRGAARMFADGAVLAPNLLVSGLLVVGAVGGYGVRVLAFLPHVPLEWAGIAIGTAGWLSDREGRLERHKRGLAAASSVCMPLCAAVVEIYLVPYR